MFRRSHSAHSRRSYEVALRKFGAFCKERGIDDVNDQSVYEVLNGFIAWNDARGIRPKTIIDYPSGVKRFLLYQDVEIDENRYRNRVCLPRVTKIDEQPLTLNTIRSLLSHGRPNKKMMALILTLVSSGMRLAEALSLRISDFELGDTPASVHTSLSQY